MTEQLKPCPFCGGEAEISHAKIENYNTNSDIHKYIVACLKCGASFNVLFDCEIECINDMLIQKWNSRI